jgi:hypothetical protein
VEGVFAKSIRVNYSTTTNKKNYEFDPRVGEKTGLAINENTFQSLLTKTEDVYSNFTYLTMIDASKISA